jgi:predicted ATPase/DNA-binding XRE family transcriptional regulator
MTSKHDQSTFGRWVKRRRRALGLTQEQLAERVCCALVTIQKIETDVRRPSSELAERIADVLAIPAESRDPFLALARIHPEARSTDLPAQETAFRISASLPALTTSIFGRGDDQTQLLRMLESPDLRWVTIVGTPGVGKTTLAVAVATEIAKRFADGVAYLPLASIDQPEQVLRVVARAFDIPPGNDESLLARLQDTLRSRHVLLVLDNVEQVAVAAPTIAALLTEVPYLKVLCTSRVRLRVSLEHLYRLAPLELPDNAARSKAELDRSPAVALFVARARAVAPHFVLNEDSAGLIAELCKQLHGLPLAIELAAGWSHLLSPQQLLEQMRQPSVVLSQGPLDRPERQRALWATLDWSYRLLAPANQVFLARLAVFAGGLTLEAAAAICCDDGPATSIQALAALAQLVDHNLLDVITTASGTQRYGFLETIRLYAYEHLVARGELEAIQRRHAAYYLSRAEKSTELSGNEQIAWYNQIEEDLPNYRAALEWSLKHAPKTALRLGAAMSKFWQERGYYVEGQKWFAQLLALPVEPEIPPIIYAQLWHGQGNLLHINASCSEPSEPSLKRALEIYRSLDDHESQLNMLHLLADTALNKGDTSTAEAYFYEALTLARHLSNAEAIARALSGLGILAFHCCAYDHARQLLLESLSIWTTEQHQTKVATVQAYLGQIERITGNVNEAWRWLQQSLAARRKSKDPYRIACTLSYLGDLALQCGDLHYAHECYHESLSLDWKLATVDLATSIEDMAGLAAACGLPYDAARWLGAASAARKRPRFHLLGFQRQQIERIRRSIEEQGDPRIIAEAWAEGERLSLAEAVDEALSLQLTFPAAAPVSIKYRQALPG